MKHNTGWKIIQVINLFLMLFITRVQDVLFLAFIYMRTIEPRKCYWRFWISLLPILEIMMGRILNLLYLNKCFFSLVWVGNFVFEIDIHLIHPKLSCQYVKHLRSLVARVQNVKILAIKTRLIAAPKCINVWRWHFQYQ